MTCYSECYMSLRPTHRDEVDSSLILSAATIGFSSRLAKSLPISYRARSVLGVIFVSSLPLTEHTDAIRPRRLPRSVRQKAAPGEGVPAVPSAYPIFLILLILIYPIDNPHNYVYVVRLPKRGRLSC